MLDPDIPADNPFLHDRVKTFQPRDLWEWLLKLAIVLFPLDVGVRRIQIDRSEWLRATQTLRRWLFFWRGVPRSPEADESLAALLARRDQVRAKQMPAVQPDPDLFKPQTPVVLVPTRREEVLTQPDGGATAEIVSPAQPERRSASTASRLLEAKRRAQQRKDL